MELAELTIPAARLTCLEEAWQAPLAIIDLSNTDIAPDSVRLPPCPLIGIGSGDAPLASCVDIVLEPPFRIETIARAVLAAPRAAATLVQVLRATQTLEVGSALAVESMAYAMLQGSAEHAAWLATRREDEARPAGAVTATRRGNRLEIVLDRPAAGNAIDRAMRDALFEALALGKLDGTIRSIRLTGRGKAFSLGADLAEFGTTADPATAHAIRSLTLPAHAAVAVADRMEVHVQGACVGAGLELAAFADRVTAGRGAWFQLPELAMGIIPGAGGCVSVPRRIGRQRTALMVLSGRRIGARQALAWGLIDALVDDGAADDGHRDVL